MIFSRDELDHLVFLSEMVLDGKRRAMMAETMQSLLYIVKSLDRVDLSEEITFEIRQLVNGVEERLRQENDRLKEIHSNLAYPNQRRPLG